MSVGITCQNSSLWQNHKCRLLLEEQNFFSAHISRLSHCFSRKVSPVVTLTDKRWLGWIFSISECSLSWDEILHALNGPPYTRWNACREYKSCIFLAFKDVGLKTISCSLCDSQKGDGIFWGWLNHVAATASRAITLTQDFEVTKDAECRDVRRRRIKVTSSREDRTVSLLCRADWLFSKGVISLASPASTG